RRWLIRRAAGSLSLRDRRAPGGSSADASAVAVSSLGILAPAPVRSKEEFVAARRTPAAGLVGFRRAVHLFPAAQNRLHHSPRPFDLIEANEKAAVAF